MTNVKHALPRGVGCALILLTAAAGTCGAQEASTPVVVSPVIEREVTTGYRVVGTLKPIKVSVIGSAIDGRVLEFKVDEGDQVSKGQPLAQLRTATLEIELAAAMAELTLREQELAELRNGARPEEIAQAEARMLSAKASHEFAQSKYDRTLSLYRQGRAATEADLDQARSLATQAKQAVLEATASYDLLKAGTRIERIKQAEAQVSLQQEQVHMIEDRITKHTLVSPFDGFVTAEHTEMGAWVMQGEPVAEVVRLDIVEVVVDAVGEVVTRLKRGTEVRLEVPAFPNDVITGEITQIVPQADVRSRTFPVIIRVKNRIEEGVPRLKAGMLARVELPAGARQRTPLVPKDALVLGGRRPLVYVVDSKGKGQNRTVRGVPVTLGVADGGLIQVSGELKQGQYVVVRGNERLQDGQTVSVSSVIPVEETKPVSTTAGGNNPSAVGSR